MPQLYTARLLRWLAAPQSTEQRNIRNVLVDGLGVGIASGIGSFLAVFLVRLGASGFTVGLLTAMPALTGMFLAVPVGRFLERQRNIVPWYSYARFSVLSCYALTGLVPFIFGDAAPAAIITIWAIATLPQSIVNVAFTVVMGSVAGPNRRFYLMSRRWSLLGITNAVVVAAVGQFLDRVVFPINYQIAFLTSFLGGLVSLRYSSSISLPEREPEPAEAPVQGLRARWERETEAIRQSPAFTRFLVSHFLFRFGLTFVLPLLPLYWVRNLAASDASIGLINTVQGAVLLGAYFFWSRMSRRFGERRVLLITSLGVVLYPVLTAVTPTVAPLVLYAALNGMFAAGTELVIFDVLLATVPPTHQTTYIGVYQTTNNMAVFFAPLLATFLAEVIGIGPALAIGTALRLAGFALFYVLRVGQETDTADTAHAAKPAGASH